MNLKQVVGLWYKVNSLVQKVKDLFSKLFDFLPSLDDLKKKFLGIVPDWMKPDADDAETEKYKNMKVTASTSDEDLRKWLLLRIHSLLQKKVY